MVATVKKTRQLPTPEELRRRVRVGQDIAGTITTGQYLQGWPAAKGCNRAPGAAMKATSGCI